VDLGSYRGYFLESVTVATTPRSTAAIAMSCGAGEHAVLTLTHVLERSPPADKAPGTGPYEHEPAQPAKARHP
jgi:hypothetical protein